MDTNTRTPWKTELPVNIADDIPTREEIDALEKLARKEFTNAVNAERNHQVEKYGSDIAVGKTSALVFAMLLQSIGNLAFAMEMSSEDITDEEAEEEILAAILRTGATVTAMYEWYRVQTATDMVHIRQEQKLVEDPWMTPEE